MAKAALACAGAYDDVQKSDDSRKIRRGVGKSRNRRYVQRKGPLIIYDVSEGLDKAFRNLPGLYAVCGCDFLNNFFLRSPTHLLLIHV